VVKSARAFGAGRRRQIQSGAESGPHCANLISALCASLSQYYNTYTESTTHRFVSTVVLGVLTKMSDKTKPIRENFRPKCLFRGRVPP